MAPEQTEPLLQFFAYGHLPEHLRAVSQPFQFLAMRLIETLPRNPERTVALRKLLESKDCAVRALLYKSDPTFKSETPIADALKHVERHA